VQGRNILKHQEFLTFSAPDLEQIRTLSPAFKNSFANAYPIPESYKIITPTENKLENIYKKYINYDVHVHVDTCI